MLMLLKIKAVLLKSNKEHLHLIDEFILFIKDVGVVIFEILQF